MTARLNRIPRVHPTRPSLLHRLRTWWLARPLRQAYADAIADHAAAAQRLAYWQSCYGATPPFSAQRAEAGSLVHRLKLAERAAQARAAKALEGLHALGVAP